MCAALLLMQCSTVRVEGSEASGSIMHEPHAYVHRLGNNYACCCLPLGVLPSGNGEAEESSPMGGGVSSKSPPGEGGLLSEPQPQPCLRIRCRVRSVARRAAWRRIPREMSLLQSLWTLSFATGPMLFSKNAAICMCEKENVRSSTTGDING